MTNHKIIDGILFKAMIINGTVHLKNNYQKINNLNVFPVPDGDTGTNMQMTMLEGIKKIQPIHENSILTISKIFSDALLIGSKGNSGVILSQFFSGVYLHINRLQKKYINVQEFIQVLISGYKHAYKAVIEPIEGTILTVLRESVEGISKQPYFQTIKEVLKSITKYAKISLSKTPDLLPILKKSNVVDSGGAGFVCILEGMLMYLDNIKLFFLDEYKDNLLQSTNSFDNDVLCCGHDKIYDIDIKNIYCTEFLIKLNNLKNFHLTESRKKFLEYGDSLILLLNNNLLKIHIHTNAPGSVLSDLLHYGELVRCKIDNMKEQSQDFLHKPELNLNIDKIKDYQIISFVSNKELKIIFQDMKVDHVICCDPKKNVNVIAEELMSILKNITVQDVIVLPNVNSNLSFKIHKILSKFTNLNIHVLSSKNIAQGYSALLVFNDSLSFQENLRIMKDHIKQSKIGQISLAQKFDLHQKDDIRIKENSFMAVFQDKILFSHEDIDYVIQKLLHEMFLVSSQSKFLTIFYDKKQVKMKYLQKIESFVSKNFSNIEIEKIENIDNVTPFIFILE
ncbi:DAK2 domain-containing protein [Candidatus Phytoplasma melaleucae]|uniref:DAK2 domain-containing protein n=1 Tax=Candidatus Phytoplasma melaleucae TaxID=2982630 RepID=A0ABT9DE62_9MOLU|nr:DAK2 domain-containing protein ['Melaleuca sp.' phytoplasma]MDO8167962.1 DAK2 domain-containing protein ['Melaleuca sp.' phytoplasma]